MAQSSEVGLVNSRLSLGFGRRSGRLLRLTNRETMQKARQLAQTPPCRPWCGIDDRADVL